MRADFSCGTNMIEISIEEIITDWVKIKVKDD